MTNRFYFDRNRPGDYPAYVTVREMAETLLREFPHDARVLLVTEEEGESIPWGITLGKAEDYFLDEEVVQIKG